MNIHQVEQLIRDLLAGKVDAAGYGTLGTGDDEEEEEEEEDGDTATTGDHRVPPAEPKPPPWWRRILILCLLAVIAPSSLYLAMHLRNTIAWEAGSTALCRDSTFSRSHHRSGTCAWHHGVAVWRYAATDTIWK
jgi:hypothetical protein